MLHVEVNLNNQSLTYIEKDLEYLLLTTNSTILGRYIKKKFQEVSLEEEEVLVIAGRSNRDMYMNAKSHLGEDYFMITW